MHRIFTHCLISLFAFFLLAGCTTTIGSTDSDPSNPTPAHILPGGIHVIADAPPDCLACQFYNRYQNSVVRIRVKNGVGTGVVVSNTGLIITNDHVVKGPGPVLIQTFDGKQVPATVVRRYPDADLALVQPDPAEIVWQPASITDVRLPPVGSPVFAIGHPAGLGWTLTEGIVSGHRQRGEVSPIPMFQIDAAVSPGNSGGPVLSANGSWLGLVSAKLVGRGVENISFIIPVADVQQFIDSYQADAEPKSP